MGAAYILKLSAFARNLSASLVRLKVGTTNRPITKGLVAFFQSIGTIKSPEDEHHGIPPLDSGLPCAGEPALRKTFRAVRSGRECKPEEVHPGLRSGGSQ